MKSEDIRNEAIRLRTQENKSLKEIASLLGISKSTASLWLRKYEVTVVRKDTERFNGIRSRFKNDQEYIETRFMNGATYETLAREYDMPPMIFKSWVFKLRIKGPGSKPVVNETCRCLVCDKDQGTSKRRYCNTCWTRLKRHVLKIKAIEYKGGKCEHCGWSGEHYGYDFHHRNPNEKDFAISSPQNRSWRVVKIEIDKCALLCAMCHRREHHIQKSIKQSERFLAAVAEFDYANFDVDSDMLEVNQLSIRSLRANV